MREDEGIQERRATVSNVVPAEEGSQERLATASVALETPRIAHVRATRPIRGRRHHVAFRVPPYTRNATSRDFTARGSCESSERATSRDLAPSGGGQSSAASPNPAASTQELSPGWEVRKNNERAYLISHTSWTDPRHQELLPP